MTRRSTTLAAAMATLFGAACAQAGVGQGEQAPLFSTFDENLEPVDMADLIRGKPLVLIVGSAS